MRKEVKIIDEPSLHLHIDYDHITIGELGNILIRLQAALRSIAGLSPGEYDGRYSKEQPRFVTSTVHTKKSIDLGVQLAILAIIMAAPGAAYAWNRFGTQVFRWLKTSILAMKQGEIEDPDEVTGGLRITIIRGGNNLKVTPQFLDQLTPQRIKAISNLLWSLTGPARKVIIRDDESEISIEWTDEEMDIK